MGEAPSTHTGQGIPASEWRFEPTAEGVRVTTTESFARNQVEADIPGMQTLVDNSLVTWLARLTEAERQP